MGARAGVSYSGGRAMGLLRHAGRGARARALLLAAGVTLLACSGERVLGDYPPSSCDLAEPPPHVADAPLSIATFWAGDTREREAFQTLYGRIDQERYAPAQETMTSRVEAQRRITAAFDLQRLPDVFQVNGGNDVLRWVEGRDAESTDVCALDRLRDSYHWQTDYFESALAPLECQGNLYGLPVGIHHLNVLFYNKRLLSELRALARERGVELPDPSALRDARALLEALRQVAALSPRTPDGAPIVPLAIGAQSEWPLTIIAFENVLLSLGDEAYETLWQGGLSGGDGAGRARLEQSLRQMVQLLRELSEVSNLDQRVSWQAALKQVEAGEALMTVTGDWGWAQMSDAAPADVARIDFPGTAGTFVSAGMMPLSLRTSPAATIASRCSGPITGFVRSLRSSCLAATASLTFVALTTRTTGAPRSLASSAVEWVPRTSAPSYRPRFPSTRARSAPRATRCIAAAIVAAGMR